MTNRYLAFDIEISKVVPEDTKDWKAHRPLGISCAATWASDEDEPWYYHGKQFVFDEAKGPVTEISPQMTEDECGLLVYDLLGAIDDGYTIVTWNGLSFDFDILAEESGMYYECRKIALNHVDPMIHFFCLKGFPVGLDAVVTKGMGLDGKPKGMDGAQAPVLWQQGEYQAVLDYVAQDVRTTLEVAQAIELKRGVWWITKRGKLSQCAFPDGLLTVKEALTLPEPDVSWMDSPLERSGFVEWMGEQAP